MRGWWNHSEACSVLGDMWRSVLLGVVLAGVLAGCSLGGGSGAASKGHRSEAVAHHGIGLTQIRTKLALEKQLLDMRTGAFIVGSLRHVVCRFGGGFVRCVGKRNGGRRVRGEFRIVGRWPEVRLVSV